MAVILLRLICIICFVKLAACKYKESLRFREDGTFKILQITDVHFGEGESQWWGPVQDSNSTRVMLELFQYENPDLVVLTGDIITGNNIKDNATAYWKKAMSPMLQLNYRWAIAFGNHDDLASGSNGTRLDLMKYDMSFDNSLSQMGPSNIHGVSNYVLPVLSSSSNGKDTEVSALLYVLDSMDQSCGAIQGYGCIHSDQIEWYRKVSTMFRQKYNKIIPSLAFFRILICKNEGNHVPLDVVPDIPLQEYMTLWNTEPCYGTNNDSVACQAANTGLFSAFQEQRDVTAVFVGHNHGNDYCGTLDGIQLCYGRHSGYGGYGNWERGARVIQIFEKPQPMQTWIRFEGGRVERQGKQHNPTPPYQQQCT